MIDSMSKAGLEAVYLANRDKLVRFLKARGAGDAAEDLVNELWFRVSTNRSGPIANPLSYLYRAANMLMIDRYRSTRQAELRDREWSRADENGQPLSLPSVDRIVEARQEAARVAAILEELGARREMVFRRSRIDGVPQRLIAEELGVSVSTVENDLRVACRVLADLKEQMR